MLSSAAQTRLSALALFFALLPSARARAGDKPVKPTATPKTAPKAPPKRPAPVAFHGGMVLPLHSEDPRFSYAPQVREVAQLGATHISFIVRIYQEHARSPGPLRHPTKTPRDAILLEAIKEARRSGMQVLLMPIVLLEKPGEDDWRGNIAPPDWDAWFAAYQNLLLHFARLAEEGGASTLLVGSELSSTEARVEDWRRLINATRRRFSGQLGYSANWDHYDEVQFWKQLDYMGISGYYELTDSLTPNLDQLKTAWRIVRFRILEWRRKQGLDELPLLFTELGYASQDGCASKPWNYFFSKTVDLEEQRLCYQAFTEVWAKVPELRGVYFYEWWGHGGPEDTSYTPRGKPVEGLLRRWYRKIRARNQRLAEAIKAAEAKTSGETEAPKMTGPAPDRPGRSERGQ